MSDPHNSTLGTVPAYIKFHNTLLVLKLKLPVTLCPSITVLIHSNNIYVFDRV